MIASTLKKWRQNWKFLFSVTVLQALVIIFAKASIRAYDDVPQAPLPIFVRVLGWPLLNNIFDLNSHSNSIDGEIAFILLVLIWNAFLWAWALLELKQVLARTFTRSSRIEQ